MKAFLEYFFIFDPVDTWQYYYQFESDLGKFFRTKGLEVQILQTAGDNKGRRIIEIRPIPSIPTLNVKPSDEVKDTSKKRLKSLGQIRKEGKFSKGQYGKLTS